MKIYTKAGDRGMTTLLGGTLVPKDHPKLEAYGTLDELNSWIGLLRDHITEEEKGRELIRIQECLMAGSGLLAREKDDNSTRLPEIGEEDIQLLEESIDAMDEHLHALGNFILPGGHPHVSYCHLARTTCRRAERLVCRFVNDSESIAVLLKYLNRLSDYLFTLSRKIATDFKVEEIPWQPEL